MTQVNLLPWREEAKKKRKLQFGIYVGIYISLGLISVIMVHLYFNNLIHRQLIRNQFLTQELEQNQTQLNLLNAKKKELMLIKDDLKFLMDLREQSYRSVAFLDAIIRITPEALSYSKITRQGNKITLIGKAKSDSQITLLMENLGKNKVFKRPDLSQITAKQSDAGDERIFELKVEQQE